MSTIIIKTKPQIEGIRESAKLLSKAMGEVAQNIEIGKNFKQLNKVAKEYITDHKGFPAFLNYNGFPNPLCISINEVVVHGIPTDNACVKEGDIISIDCGVNLNGFFSDMAYTFKIGNVDKKTSLLAKHTKESLNIAIEQAQNGKFTGDIGFSIEEYLEPFGYGIVRDLVGHGVGVQLHEKPDIPNYGRRGKGKKLKQGMTIAIEPMINLGTYKVAIMEDQWTVCTTDGKPSAHYEHTILITDKKPEVLTSFQFIENAIENNKNIS